MSSKMYQRKAPFTPPFWRQPPPCFHGLRGYPLSGKKVMIAYQTCQASTGILFGELNSVWSRTDAPATMSEQIVSIVITARVNTS